MDKRLKLLFNVDAWVRATTAEQDTSIDYLSGFLQDDFLWIGTRSYGDNRALRIPTFREIDSGLDLVLIIGGVSEVGVSQNEVEQMLSINSDLHFTDEVLPPVSRVRVFPFLMSQLPVLQTTANEYIEVDDELYRPEFNRAPDAQVPIHLTRDELRLLNKALGGFHIPSEVQWEYAYRAGTKTLFNFGSQLPTREELDEKVLLTDFSDSEKCLRAANPFRLVGMNSGEWCADSFHRSTLPVNDKPIDDGPPYVIRGGAATLWPWQSDTEWTYLISGARWNSEGIEDGVCGARFVYQIFEA